MTRRYVRYLQDDIRQVHEKASPVQKLQSIGRRASRKIDRKERDNMLPPELEREIIDKLIEFDNWVKANAENFKRMREEEEDETDDSNHSLPSSRRRIFAGNIWHEN